MELAIRHELLVHEHLIIRRASASQQTPLVDELGDGSLPGGRAQCSCLVGAGLMTAC
jgi:hypothetical protein